MAKTLLPFADTRLMWAMRCIYGALACVGWALLVLYGMRPSDWTGVIVFSFYGSIVGAVALSLVGAVAAARDPDLPGWIRWLAVAAGITIPLSVILFAAVLIHALSGSDG